LLLKPGVLDLGPGLAGGRGRTFKNLGETGTAGFWVADCLSHARTGDARRVAVRPVICSLAADPTTREEDGWR
jgi:hypothetical protein